MKRGTQEGTVVHKDGEIAVADEPAGLLTIGTDRVHLAETGHPLLGDRRYGEDRAGPMGRLALHAVSLEIEHPATGRRERFESQPPRAFLTPFR